MNDISIYTIILAWCTFHLALMVIRLPFSDEKLGRLKTFGLGVLCLIGLIILVLATNWLLGQDWFHRFVEQRGSDFGFVFKNICVLFVGCLALFAAFGLLLGHMGKMVSSWAVNDTEIWNQCN